MKTLIKASYHLKKMLASIGRDWRRRKDTPLKSPVDREEEKTVAFIIDTLGIDINSGRIIILLDWFEML